MKRWLKKWLPSNETIQKDKSLHWLAAYKYPYIWAFNRKAVAKGVAAGLLVAFIPVPLQILFAAIVAFLVRGNLPVAIISTLISNPFTFVPLSFLIYKVGVFITGSNGASELPSFHKLEFHWESITLIWQETIVWFKSLGKSYFIGLLVVSVTSSVLGYFMIDAIWRIYIWYHLRARRNRSFSKNN